MRNPFRNEADAFRLVLLAVGYFALIVVAAAINTWLGVAVFVLLTLIAIAAVVRARREPPQQAVIRPPCKTARMRHDQSDEANAARRADRTCRQERGK